MKKGTVRRRKSPAKTQPKSNSADLPASSVPATEVPSPLASGRFLNLSPREWDVLNLAIVMLVAILIRLPFVHARVLVDDEAEFMATAVYTQAMGQSAFNSPVHPYTIAAYRCAVDWFGRYNMLPLRAATDILAALIAGLIYLWLVRSTARWCALFVGVCYGVYSMYYNGCLVGREFPCSFALVVGAYLFLLSRDAVGRRERWLLLASGVATGAALFWKEQAAYITQAIPLWLVLQALCQRRWQPWLGQGLWYAAGGLLAGVFYVIPFLLTGTLSARIEGFLEYAHGFSGFGKSFPQRLLPESTRIFDQFYWLRPAKLLLLSGYGVCLLELLLLGRRLWAGNRPDGTPEKATLRCRDSGLLAVCYIVTSSAAVSMGHRYGVGYFLLWLPFIFIAAGHGLYLMVTNSTGWLGVAAMLGLVFVGLTEISDGSPIVCMFILVAMGASAAVWLVCQRRLGWRMTNWLQTVLAAMFLGMLFLEEPRVTAWSNYAAELDAYSGLHPSVLFIQQHAEPGDRLFVWGWQPEYYCRTLLEPASRCVVCGYADGCWFEEDGIPRGWTQRLVTELSAQPPRFIITAAPDYNEVGHLMKISRQQSPEFAEFVEANYHLAKSFAEDCRIFESNEHAAADGR